MALYLQLLYFLLGWAGPGQMVQDGCKDSVVCSEKHGCAGDGSNELYIVTGVETEPVCQAVCAANQECRLYTWYGRYTLQYHYQAWDCVLLRDCDKHSECQDCHTGPPICNGTTTTSPSTTTQPSMDPGENGKEENTYSF